jgi:hypothetical protein
MKKIFTLLAAVLAWAGVQAEEKTVWQGNEAISWNTEVAPGTQFETPEGIFTGLQKDNTIRIYTTTTYDDPQYVVTYKAGDSWEWTDLTTTITDGVISYTVENDDIATWIAERGLVIRGQAYSITRITVDAEAPQPVEGEQTVWEGNEAISWNTEVAPGTQYELTGIFASLAEGDVLRFYTTATIDEPQYVVTYKAGDSWEWTDLSITTANSIITYTVDNSQVATEIAERGLIMRGQGYTLTKVTVTKSGTATIVGMRDNRSQHEGITYNLAGQRVDAAYKGVVVVNGRKYCQK